MSSGHNTKFHVGVGDYYITQVRRVLNEFFDSDEVSEDVISDFLTATRADYNHQTGSTVSNWDAQGFGLNYTVARVAAMFVALALSARSFSGGNMSYRIGNLEVDRKDTIDFINFYKDMIFESAIKYGFHPRQGVVLAELTTSLIGEQTLIPMW